MRDRITSVQLAILDTKQSRAKQLEAQLDAIHDEVAELLEIRPGEMIRGRWSAMDYIVDFLSGCYAPAKLADKLGIEVAP